MRIAQLVPIHNPVEIRSTHAIFSHTAMLTDTMVAAGHQVDVYGSSNSRTAGTNRGTEDSAAHLLMPADVQRHYVHALISDCYANAGEFDLIHSHFTLLSAFYARMATVPTLISLHSPIREDIRPLLARYSDLQYVSFSFAQRKQMPELNWVANIYHGIDTELFAFNREAQDYFLYLGRVTEEKGVHLAIEAAKAAGVKLRIAGGSYSAEGYWHKSIEPEINGKTVRYMGEADQAQKIQLLRGAKALLFPTQYDETFGLVMIEAMSCGTPVIAWRNGSVPEVVADGRTGYIVDSVEGMVAAIKAIDRISRVETRSRAVTYFSQQKMTSGYLKVYERIIESARRKRTA